MKIVGNLVGTTLPKPNFKQTDPTKGDYIKGKPSLKSLSEKDIAEKADLSSEVQASLDKADVAILSTEQMLTEDQKVQARENIGAVSTEYVIRVFEELKTLIQAGNTGGAIAVLDEAILDLAELA